MDVVLRYADDNRNSVVGADLGEGPGGIACRLYDKYLFRLFRQSGADRKSFRLLEGTSLHLSSFLRPVAGESDVEILQAQFRRKPFAFICDGSTRVLQRPLDGHPAGISI